MSTFAAVMTGKGTGAISTIQIFGHKAEDILRRIFQPAGTKSADFAPGKILLGTISNGTETIDQVTIGCEGQNNFAINCHGNPLIVEMIMQLLQQYGVKLISRGQLLTKILSTHKRVSTIALEASLTQLKAKTIEGTKIIVHQIDAGLGKKAAHWLQDIKSISLDEISAQAEQILKNSQPAKLIMFGCTVAIVGPPNTGKSTLLNYLAGRQKAIVTDIKGTTRDWVSAQCYIQPLAVELIDTAGLDEQLAASAEEAVEFASQRRSLQILGKADLILLVLDNSQPTAHIGKRLLKEIAGKKILTVLNKSDLPAHLDTAQLPENLANTVQISAKFGTGIEKLLEKIRQICGVDNFDLKGPVCFTSRQEKLLKQLKNAQSKRRTASIITELLKGQLCV